jgi:hypothetical protein
LPEADVAAPHTRAIRNPRSRAAEIPEAPYLYLPRRADRSWIRRGQGYWKGRADIGDGVEYQQRLREDPESS